MGQKIPELAVEKFSMFFAETLSCATAQVPIGTRKKRLYKLTFFPPAPVNTVAGGQQFIAATHVFTVGPDSEHGGYKVSSREYFYKLSDNPDENEHDKGAFSYHWHPNGYPIQYPHLHVTVTSQLGYHGLEAKINRAHYPTSRVCVEDFVRLLIEGYDIKPIRHRAEWGRILKKNKGAFHRSASWFINHPTF